MPVLEMAEATAVAGAVARETFAYNRENYMFDQGLRFGRFNTGYSMAMAQASQYREDISDMTEFTVTKADAYHTVGTICFVLNFQLIMAGRLGVHGPSPPGWLLGLYWTNICSALMFLVTFTWMAMHAGARATAGAAYMRTRTVRLPIPTPKMLDSARRTGNSFEKQRVNDMFRIPFVTPAPKESEVDEETGDIFQTGDRRMPRWYRDEIRELRKDEGGPQPNATSVPEHFELYRGLQEEWWAYDVYCRIGVLFFFSHWLTSASLYSMCHIFTELRCVWPAWTTAPMFITAHYGILKLDITAKPREGGMGVPMERIVPFVPMIAVLGMSLDYSVLKPSAGVQTVIYALSWVCYIIQFLWALRLYQLAAPQNRFKDAPEVPGQPWVPKEWPVPPAFANAVYVVSAPKFLEPGQTCLQQEMKAARGEKGDKVPQKKSRDAPPSMLPWKLFRGACITMISMWILIMVGRAFEQVNGERWLLKQENRVERWPTHMQPWITPWTRKGRRDEWCHSGGCDRRLAEDDSLSAAAQRLISAMAPLADAFDSTANRVVEPMPTVEQAAVQFPEGLRPELLASHEGVIAALERGAGRGALVRGNGPAQLFEIHGLQGLGELLGASWSQAGLMLTHTNGALAECAGMPVAGIWSCQPAAVAPLPAGLRAAAAARSPAGALRAAAAFDGEDAVVMFELDTDGEWAPAGEVHSPSANGRTMTLSLSSAADNLIISLSDGTVVRRGVAAGAHAEQHRVQPPADAGAWHGSCCMGGGRMARLSAGAQPQLFFGSAM